MAYNIESFKNQIQNIQKNSLYLVTMSLPAIFKNANGIINQSVASAISNVFNNDSSTSINQSNSINETRLFSFRCKSSSFTAEEIPAIDVSFMGRKVKYHGQRKYEGSWSTTIILDERWSTYEAIYQWMEMYNSAIGNYAMAMDESMNNYKTDAYIQAFSSIGKRTKGYKLVGVFPTEIASNELDWSQTDSSLDLSVTFAYDYWYTFDETSHMIADEFFGGSNSNKDTDRMISDYYSLSTN